MTQAIYFIPIDTGGEEILMTFRESILLFKQATQNEKAAMRGLTATFEPEAQALVGCLGTSAEYSQSYIGENRREPDPFKYGVVNIQIPSKDYSQTLCLQIPLRQAGAIHCDFPFWTLNCWGHSGSLHTFVNKNVWDIWNWFRARTPKFGISLGKEPHQKNMGVLAHRRLQAFGFWQDHETDRGDKLYQASQAWGRERDQITKMIKSKIPHIKIDGDAELRLVADEWKLESFVWSSLWDEKPELEYHFRLNSPDRDSWDWKFPHTATLQEMATKMVEAWRDKLAHHILHHFAKPELVEA